MIALEEEWECEASRSAPLNDTLALGPDHFTPSFLPQHVLGACWAGAIRRSCDVMTATTRASQ